MSQAQITIKVTGMTCMGCAGSVERSLKAIPGVTNACVDLGAAEATVDYDPANLSVDAIKQILKEAGWGVQ
jgi:copper chaperone CopZ